MSAQGPAASARLHTLLTQQRVAGTNAALCPSAAAVLTPTRRHGSSGAADCPRSAYWLVPVPCVIETFISYRAGKAALSPHLDLALEFGLLADLGCHRSISRWTVSGRGDLLVSSDYADEQALQSYLS